MRYFKTLGALGALAIMVATLAILLAGPASAGPSGTVKCSTFPGTGAPGDPYLITGTVDSNLVVDDGRCRVTDTGIVVGNVTVMSDSVSCPSGTFIAINVMGGTIKGNVRSSGGPCVMIWLNDGALVEGDVIHDSLGNVGFTGGGSGAIVEGHVVAKNGHLWAGAASATNQIYGNIICSGDGAPFVGPGNHTNWDGSNGKPKTGIKDGVLSGNYNC